MENQQNKNREFEKIKEILLECYGQRKLNENAPRRDEKGKIFEQFQGQLGGFGFTGEAHINEHDVLNTGTYAMFNLTNEGNDIAGVRMDNGYIASDYDVHETRYGKDFNPYPPKIQPRAEVTLFSAKYKEGEGQVVQMNGDKSQKLNIALGANETLEGFVDGIYGALVKGKTQELMNRLNKMGVSQLAFLNMADDKLDQMAYERQYGRSMNDGRTM